MHYCIKLSRFILESDKETFKKMWRRFLACNTMYTRRFILESDKKLFKGMRRRSFGWNTMYTREMFTTFHHKTKRCEINSYSYYSRVKNVASDVLRSIWSQRIRYGSIAVVMWKISEQSLSIFANRNPIKAFIQFIWNGMLQYGCKYIRIFECLIF